MTDAFEGWMILELMGHRRLAGYVREAENLVHAIGEPFPELPATMLESAAESSEGPATWGLLRETTWKSNSVPSGIRTRVNPQESASSPKVSGYQEESNTRTPTRSYAAHPGADASRTEPASPRASMLTHLSTALGGALAAGDMAGAAVVNEAIGKLLLAALERPEASTAAALKIPIGSLSTRITEIRRYIRRRRDLDK